MSDSMPVTESERTIEGARDRFRRLTDAVMKKSQQYVIDHRCATDGEMLDDLITDFLVAADDYLEATKHLT